jgi:hypothetical protein
LRSSVFLGPLYLPALTMLLLDVRYFDICSLCKIWKNEIHSSKFKILICVDIADYCLLCQMMSITQNYNQLDG